MSFYKFPSIESFHNKVKIAQKYGHNEEVFIIKPKLHGTNAAIVFKDGKVYAQSRNRILTEDSDNAGFAAFVDSLDLTPNEYNYVVYGEWCGGNVQKGCDAICQLENKVFAVFAVYDLDSNIMYNGDDNLEYFVRILNLAKDTVVVGSIGMLEFSFLKGGEATDFINSMVANFEEIDPWVKSKFGIEGRGEGVVVSPLNCEFEHYSNWTFKAKTSAHSVNKSKKAAQANPQVSEDVVAFAEQFATEARFTQAMSDTGIDFGMENMGVFLKWVSQDARKESVDELEASGLDWKQCARVITSKAKMWFLDQHSKT